MKDLKIGDWATDTCSNETFIILKEDEYCIPMTTYSEDAYFDIYYQGHVTYHCQKAKQKDIERVCLEMLELEFK